MKLKTPFLIKPDTKVKLSSFATDETGEFADADAAATALEKHRDRLSELQELFFADQSKALLVVLQGMDTAGKDGTIRHIFTGVNPQGCEISAFKVPNSLELRHDFLWRCHQRVPPRGIFGIFNRSHYEDVLSPSVHDVISKKETQTRLDDISAWEKTLTDNNTIILKFFLHISHGEQTRRLQARIDDPSKHWKLSAGDFEERRFWPEYMSAYEDILRHTSTKHAPWFVIPSDRKWFRNVAISSILVQVLEDMKLKYPTPAFDPSGIDLKTESAKQVARQTSARTSQQASAAAPPQKVK